MKRTLWLWVSLLVLAAPALVHAAPAPPVPFAIEQPDGSEVSVVAEGDEFGMVVETTDGYALARAPGGWWSYAQVGADGQLAPSGHVPGQADAAAAGIARHLRPSAAVRAETERRRAEANRFRGVHPALERRKRRVVETAGVTAAAAGGAEALAATAAGIAPASYRLAVLLVEFPAEMTPWSPAVPHTYGPAQIDEMMFSVGTYFTSPLGNLAYGSVRDYFRSVSLGQFDLTGQVFPWVLADHGYEYYNTPGNGVTLLREEAIAKSGVELSQFDGHVVIWAGKASSGMGLWPHAALSGPYYVMSEKFWSYDDLAGIGTHAHEFGHVLGLPDLYHAPTDVGPWSLMGSGNYGGNPYSSTMGRLPTQLFSSEKELLGWAFPRVLAEGTFPGVTLRAWNDHPDAVKLVSQSGVYFLENRQPVGWDQELAGSGVLVLDVDRKGWSANPVDVEEADGTPPYDAGDPFPGTSGNAAFGCATAPSSRDVDGSCSVEVSNIAVFGSVATLDAVIDWPLPGAGIQVSGSGDFPNAATAMETAVAGQIVEVPAGTFSEAIRMRTGIGLRGAGAGKTTLTPPPEGGHMVEGADDTTLSGFTLRGSAKSGDGYILRTHARGTVRIANNAFVGLAGGVEITFWNNAGRESPGVLEIANNVFDGNAYAIMGQIDDDPVVVNDVFVGNDYGIYLYGEGTSTAVVDHDDFLANGVDYDGPTRQTVGRNNLAVDPKFVNPAAGDYALLAGSPLVNAGSPDPRYADLDGTRSDIGLGGGPFAVAPAAVVAGARVTETGKYQTTAVGKTKTTVWFATSVFTRGDTVVLRVLVTDAGGAPVSGAAVAFSVTGPASAQLASAATGSNGVAEAKWTTTPPDRKGVGGTPLGTYTAVVTGVTGAGVAWNGQATPVAFEVR